MYTVLATIVGLLIIIAVVLGSLILPKGGHHD